MLRVGIIGFGGMGHNHAGSYLRHPDCQLVAVADKREEQLSGKSMEINLGEQQAVRGVSVRGSSVRCSPIFNPLGDGLLTALAVNFFRG